MRRMTVPEVSFLTILFLGCYCNVMCTALSIQLGALVFGSNIVLVCTWGIWKCPEQLPKVKNAKPGGFWVPAKDNFTPSWLTNGVLLNHPTTKLQLFAFVHLCLKYTASNFSPEMKEGERKKAQVEFKADPWRCIDWLNSAEIYPQGLFDFGWE